MIQKLGGWDAFYNFPIGSIVRDLHAWQGLTTDQHLGVGAESMLGVITSGSNQDITPQTSTRNFAPNFSISSGSQIVTIVDAGSSASVYDAIFFNTPVAVGNLLLNGAYQIFSISGSSGYTIVSSIAASTTIVSSGILPIFNVTAGSPTITVTLPNNGVSVIPGLYQSLRTTTTVGGLVIYGPYQIASVVNSTNFTINASVQSSATATGTMNSSQVQLVYYITLGPQATGSGYGIGGYGLGGYGTGTATTGATGTPITTTDWSLVNWGEALLACPVDGPIYVWSAQGGFNNASVIVQAPFFNGGIFVSMPQQILVAWRSTQDSGTQDPLTIRWCDAGDYTNWAVTSQTTAGDFHIPTGSRIVGGLQAANVGYIWTDLSCWIMQYVGGDIIFNFTNIGNGCGLIGPHAAGVLNGNVYWCGLNNFFVSGATSVQPLPCTVWDFIFQNLDESNQDKVVCAPDSPFNEIFWYFPSSASATGENDAFVKYNVIEKSWDYGYLDRTAWEDVTILGNPIGSDASTNIWQHEETTDAGGVAMTPSFTTGWWTIADGNEMAFVDFIIPDFKFTLYNQTTSASILVTFYAADYPNDTPRMYGPYTVTNATQKINVRIRGRLMKMRAESQDAGTWWRIGRIRYRYATSGRR